MRKKIAFLYIVLVVVSSTLPFLSPVRASQVQNSPSNNNEPAWWDTPENAYASDNAYAPMGRVDGGFHEIEYFDYGFNIPDSTIDEVWLYAEHKSGHTNDSCEVRLSWNNGSDWTDWEDMPVTQFEVLWDVDFSDVREWSYTDFTDENFRVELRADIEATGCYFPESEVSLWEDKTVNFDMAVKKIKDVQKGDVLLGYDSETGEYIPNVMRSDAEILKGDFTFYRFIAEHPMKLWDKAIYPWTDGDEVGHKDICVTSEQRIFTSERGLIPAGEVKMGMHFQGLFRQNGQLITLSIPIVEIEMLKGDTAVTLDGTSDYFFSHYLYGKTGKTYFLDWLPVKVVYTETEEWVDCQHIGVNNTLAGEVTLFSADWTDINASENGVSHFLFSTNNTGVWVNETSWSDAWRDVVWSDAVKTLNSTECIIAFRFYINVTDSSEYVSTICYFPTFIEPFDWFMYMLIVGIIAVVLFIYALTTSE